MGGEPRAMPRSWQASASVRRSSLVPRAAVNEEGVDGVVAVGLGLEHQSEEQPAHAQFGELVEPGEELGQPVLDRPAGHAKGGVVALGARAHRGRR